MAVKIKVILSEVFHDVFGSSKNKESINELYCRLFYLPVDLVKYPDIDRPNNSVSPNREVLSHVWSVIWNIENYKP